jgi:threonine/homoserine/homoserine lactone efflux protein
MSDAVNLPLILAAGFISTASPGPAILAISGTSLKQGRGFGLALAAGVTCGSLLWSTAAAAGLGVVMLANAWVFETMRFLGALYLGYLALKAARSAMTSRAAALAPARASSRRAAYLKGLAIHLTNPKPILFFGALYGLGVPAQTPAQTLALIVMAVGLQSAAIFHSYALLFSNPWIADGYLRLRRGFEAAFALAFGAAAWKLLTARVHA